ncbi:hypothetical protein SOVF_063240 isoform A [Spinacia oleracea]|nr:hypothetical protein SOVF_063240 isoform A [Spinacia oleracea]
MILWCSQLQKRVIHISYEASCEKICKEYKSAVKPAAPCVKIEPGNNEGSATCPSQDVSTPKPPALSSKGGRTTTQLKKPKTAKRMASAIKDPTASKSKMQSHTKSAKPAGGFRRKTKLLRGRSWKMEKLDRSVIQIRKNKPGGLMFMSSCSARNFLTKRQTGKALLFSP